MAGMKALVGLAFAGCIGLTLLVLACALPNCWWPLFVLIFYFIAPLPVSIAQRMSDGTEQSNPCMEFAVFTTTGVVVSAFAMPVVLSLAGIVTATSAALACGGSMVNFVAIAGWFMMHREDDWTAGTMI